MKNNDLLKKIAQSVYSSLRTTQPNASIYFSRAEGKIKFIGEDFDDAYIICIGSAFLEHIYALSDKEKEGIKNKIMLAERELLTGLCEKMGMQVPDGDNAILKYMIESYAKALGKPIEIQIRFNTIMDCLQYGCVILLALRNNELISYLIWTNNESVSVTDRFYGISGDSIKFMCLFRTPIHESTSSQCIYYRTISRMQDAGAANIEDCINLMLRREIVSELSNIMPVIGEIGRSEADKRWRGDLLSIAYSDFDKIPFLPREAINFAKWVGKVANVSQFGDPATLAKLEMTDCAFMSAIKICMENDIQAYKSVIKAADRLPVSMIMGIGGIIITTRILKPYQNPPSPDYREQIRIDRSHAIGVKWRRENMDKTVARISIGFNPFYPFYENGSFALNFTRNTLIVPDIEFTSLSQFGKSIDLVIPDKYAESGKMDEKDMLWLNSIQESVCNFAYSYLCAKPFDLEHIFSDILDRMEQDSKKSEAGKKKKLY